MLLVLLLAVAGGAWAQGPYPNTGPQTVCITGVSTPYGVINTPGSTYNWTIDGATTSPNWTLNNSATNLISVVWLVPGIYTVQSVETNSLGCLGTPVQVQVTVRPLPVATASSNSPVCEGTQLTLTGGPAGMTTYAWTGPNGFTANTQSPTVAAAATPAMAGVYTLTVTDASGCVSTPATTTVVVNASPVATASSNSPVCQGTQLTLTGGPAGMTTYAWTGPNGFTANTQSPTVAAAATPAMAGVYTLTVTDASGCVSTPATTNVVVNAAPTPVITGSDPVCQNAVTEIYSTPDIPGHTYNWTVVGGTFTGQGTNQIAVTWTTAGPGSVSVIETVTSSGCSATATRPITVNPAPATSPIYHN